MEEIRGGRHHRRSSRRVPFNEINTSEAYRGGSDESTLNKNGQSLLVDTTPSSNDNGLENCQRWTPTKAFDLSSDLVKSPTFSSPQSLASSDGPPSKKLLFDCCHMDSEAETLHVNKSTDCSPYSESQANLGLRHISVAICQAVQLMGTTTYNEVAEQMIRQVHEDKGDDNHKGCDEKNVRRRVYDSLNVLLAVGVIAKRDKEITWQGMPNEAHREYSRLMAESLDLRKRIIAKQDALREQLSQQLCYRNLVIHNQRREQASQVPVDMIPAPFIIVNAHPFTEIHCDATRDQTHVKLDFNAPFSIHDDGSILRHMGFDKVPLSVLQEMLPEDLLSYCRQKGILNSFLVESRNHSSNFYQYQATVARLHHLRSSPPNKRAKPATKNGKRYF